MPQEEASLTVFPEVVDGLVDDVVRGAAERACPRVVIDGRSGAGKTTTAHRIASEIGARVVSLDEFYPGWHGLAEGGRIAADLLRAHADGRTGQYRRWDWARDAWQPEVRTVDPAVPLIMEGCGALSHGAAAAPSTVTVWMDGDAQARYALAIARDGDGFREHWSTWAEQEDAHIARHRPRRLARFAADVC